jgi:OFA family oxalate/formate antiporter-like MFS transporter
MGREASLAAMYAGLGVMLLVWWVASSWWLLAFFAVVFGICYGGYVALMPTIVMDLYGPRAVSGITGCLYTGAGLGTLFGPWLAGVAYDAYASYDAPILGGSLFSFLAAAIVVFMLRNEKAQAGHRG